jgi:methionyl-tRNA formyltransferase
MSGWNHRVIRREDPKTGETYYQIHEVYYDDDGKINGWTKLPISPYAESTDELRQELQRFMEALNKPILREDVNCGKAILVEIRNAC